jgi:hypothetical protein
LHLAYAIGGFAIAFPDGESKDVELGNSSLLKVA